MGSSLLEVFYLFQRGEVEGVKQQVSGGRSHPLALHCILDVPLGNQHPQVTEIPLSDLLCDVDIICTQLRANDRNQIYRF